MDFRMDANLMVSAVWRVEKGPEVCPIFWAEPPQTIQERAFRGVGEANNHFERIPLFENSGKEIIRSFETGEGE
jgi:hypothetical protein